MDIVNRATAKPFITRDGSEIRELLAYRNSVIRNQSLAEATLAPGAATREHYHPKSEEIYYILRGRGRMKLDGELREIGPLDAIAIPPGARHKIWNIGPDPLVLLCCCAPAYENDDTVMVE
jgi:mannose-6-phosphate isomerase-like protein (cupin superfamily)